jgi:hypothetical protein
MAASQLFRGPDCNSSGNRLAEVMPTEPTERWASRG